MNVLFIGNSYTYYNDMPKLFETLCRENGKDVTAYSVTKGGRELRRYADSADETTKALDALLAEHSFDICFLQEQSTLPLRDYEAFAEGLGCVLERNGVRTARCILYATWGRKEGSHTLETYGWTNKSMSQLLDNAYSRAAEAFHLEVSRVGQRFYNVHSGNTGVDLYSEDLSHPSYYGSCLAALTHYHTVFCQLPCSMKSLALEPEVEAHFQKAFAGFCE